MLFKDVVGQEPIKNKLVDTVKENRISHAQLFIGPEGSGKLALALAYAQYICCENKQDNDSCGVCDSCNKYQKLIHPDLHFVFPIVSPKSGKKISETYIAKWREKIIENSYFNLNGWIELIGSENQQGLIYTDESREIMSKINMKPYESDYKVMIIWMAEKMHNSIANKLLKIFEEPPEKTLFILIAEQPDILLPTIISRMQIVKIPKIDDLSMREFVCNKYNLEEDVISSVVRLSNGNLVKLIENINLTGKNEKNFDLFVRLMRNSYSLDFEEMSDLSEDMKAYGREYQKQFLKYAIRMIREYFLLSSGNTVLSKLTNIEAGKDEKFASVFPTFINARNIKNIYEELNKAYFHVERNGAGKIIFFDLMLKTHKLLKQ